MAHSHCLGVCIEGPWAGPNLSGGQGLFQPEVNLQSPMALQYNLTLERQITPSIAASVGYVGMHGTHLLRTGDVNAPTPKPLPDGKLFTAIGTPRPNPSFSAIELKTSDGDSSYNALQAHIEKRVRSSIEVRASYTFGRVIDDGSASTRSAFLNNEDVFR